MAVSPANPKEVIHLKGKEAHMGVALRQVDWDEKAEEEEQHRQMKLGACDPMSHFRYG